MYNPAIDIIMKPMDTHTVTSLQAHAVKPKLFWHYRNRTQPINKLSHNSHLFTRITRSSYHLTVLPFSVILKVDKVMHVLENRGADACVAILFSTVPYRIIHGRDRYRYPYIGEMRLQISRGRSRLFVTVDVPILCPLPYKLFIAFKNKARKKIKNSGIPS